MPVRRGGIAFHQRSGRGGRAGMDGPQGRCVGRRRRVARVRAVPVRVSRIPAVRMVGRLVPVTGMVGFGTVGSGTVTVVELDVEAGQLLSPL